MAFLPQALSHLPIPDRKFAQPSVREFEHRKLGALEIRQFRFFFQVTAGRPVVSLGASGLVRAAVVGDGGQVSAPCPLICVLFFCLLFGRKDGREGLGPGELTNPFVLCGFGAFVLTGVSMDSLGV